MSADQPEAPDPRAVSTLASQELLQRLRRGDEQAANRLFARYLPQLNRWAHGRIPRWTKGVVDTADVVQDALLHTFRRLPSFQPQRDGALLGYLRRTLVNGVRDQFRIAGRRRPMVPLDRDHAGSTASPLDLVITGETRERYLAALNRLRPDDRHAIVARLDLGYTYEQLALMLRKPTAEAARLAVRRALLRLAREMQRD